MYIYTCFFFFEAGLGSRLRSGSKNVFLLLAFKCQRKKIIPLPLHILCIRGFLAVKWISLPLAHSNSISQVVNKKQLGTFEGRVSWLTTTRNFWTFWFSSLLFTFLIDLSIKVSLLYFCRSFFFKLQIYYYCHVKDNNHSTWSKYIPTFQKVYC